MHSSATITTEQKPRSLLPRIMFSMVLMFFLTSGHAFAEIRFGVTPYLSEENLTASFEPLLKELSRQIGEDVKLVITRNYSDLTEKMQVGHIDFGSFSPFAYVDAKEKASVSIFASHCVDGKPYYQGVIVTETNSGYNTIDHLADKTFAFVDPKSASGFLYPRSLLIKEGKNPDLFFGKTFFAGSHDNVITSILDKKADAGAVYSDALKMAERQYGAGTLRVLLKTDPIPYDAYVARKGIDPALLNKVKNFFLSLSDTREPLKSVLEQKKGIAFTGWINAEDSRYDVVRETAGMSQHKKKVAVFNFTPSGAFIKKHKLNEVFSEITSAYLAETKHFNVIPRFQLEKTLLNKNLSFDTPVNATLLNILKQELNLDYMLSGEVSGNNQSPVVNCTLYSTHTATDNATIRFKSGSVEDLGEISRKCVQWIQKNIPLEAYIMGINGKVLQIEGGLDMGFSKNDVFSIVNLGEKRYSKDKKSIVGRKRRQVAEGVFRSVTKDSSEGIITHGNINQVDVGSRIRILQAGFSKSEDIYVSYIKSLKALSKGNNREAIKLLTKVINADPDYAMAHARLSTAYYNSNNTPKGKAHLTTARAHSGSITFQERNYILARYSTETGDKKTAESLYLEILEKYPNNTSAMHNLGMLYMGSDTKEKREREDKMNKAMLYFERALHIDPDLTISRNAISRLKEIKSGTTTNKADIVVIFDTTGSMGQEIKGMIKNTEKFTSYLSDKGIDVNLGLISFGDGLRNAFFENGKSPVLTSDIKLFVEKLREFVPEGGGDKPENPFIAFEKSFSYPFRKNCRTVFLLITDAPAHVNDHIYPRDIDHIINELKKRDISAAIIGPENKNYKRITEETGGILVNISSTPDFSRKILEIGNTIVHLF